MKCAMSLVYWLIKLLLWHAQYSIAYMTKRIEMKNIRSIFDDIFNRSREENVDMEVIGIDVTWISLTCFATMHTSQKKK